MKNPTRRIALKAPPSRASASTEGEAITAQRAASGKDFASTGSERGIAGSAAGLPTVSTENGNKMISLHNQIF